MYAKTKVAGTWRDVSVPYIKVSGVWKIAKAAYIKIAGAWKAWFLQGGIIDREFSAKLSDFVLYLMFNTLDKGFRNSGISLCQKKAFH
jgi:hypothetical protein